MLFRSVYTNRNKSNKDFLPQKVHQIGVSTAESAQNKKQNKNKSKEEENTNTRGVGEVVSENLVEQQKDNTPPVAVAPQTEPPPMTDEATEILTALQKFWGIQEMNQNHAYRQLANFARTITHRGRADYFKSNFTAYAKLIHEGRKRHTWSNFIGTPQEFYEDGSWALQNFQDELTKSKQTKRPEVKRGMVWHSDKPFVPAKTANEKYAEEQARKLKETK